jgi:hypothetical protein
MATTPPPTAQTVLAGVLAVLSGAVGLVFAGYLFVLLAVINGLTLTAGSGLAPFGLLADGVGAASGIVVLVSGALLLTNPRYARRWGILALVFSTSSLLGGFIFVPGFALGVLAGILAVLPSERPPPPWWGSGPAPPPQWIPFAPAPVYWLRYCPACGAPLAPNASFCSACGTNLTGVGARSTGPNPGGVLPPVRPGNEDAPK